MTQSEISAHEFYEKVVNGTESYKNKTLEHDEGWTLDGFKMHTVDKGTLADTISELPEEMFKAAEDVEDEAEAEERLEEAGITMADIDSDTVDAFENLVVESLSHPDLTQPQIRDIVEAYDFDTLFELGSEVLNYSMEETGQVRSFQEQA